MESAIAEESIPRTNVQDEPPGLCVEQAGACSVLETLTTDMTRDELPVCVEHTSALDFSHLTTKAEDVVLDLTGESFRQIIRMWLGGWHATSEVGLWAMSLWFILLHRTVERRFP
ncbi:UNVERIFIED_CONTAM: hypothetical protein Sangu_1549500 [Sesamum angustifolium]|uniref:Uncharacterized protein n=1 Tax=Sesamum angustifolium TaxID=2727405 RepID=A0AAW2MSK1_9LAMI